MASKLKVSWKKEAEAKPEVDMNGEIKNVNSLKLATWNTNEVRFLQNHWKGWEIGHLEIVFYFLNEEENGDERTSMYVSLLW